MSSRTGCKLSLQQISLDQELPAQNAAVMKHLADLKQYHSLTYAGAHSLLHLWFSLTSLLVLGQSCQLLQSAALTIMIAVSLAAQHSCSRAFDASHTITVLLALPTK